MRKLPWHWLAASAIALACAGAQAQTISDSERMLTAEDFIEAFAPDQPAARTRGTRGVQMEAIPEDEAEPASPAEPAAAADPSPQPTAEPGTATVETVQAPAEAPTVALRRIQFAFGSADLTPQAIEVVRELGFALRDPRLEGATFRISGHTDAVGSDQANARLSQARAEAVRDALVLYYGVQPERLEAVGFGEAKLADPSQPESGVNRRVEISKTGQ